MIAFLVLSITPLTLLALFFLQSHTSDLRDQSTNHMASLRSNQKEQLINYFNDRRLDIDIFASSELATNSGGRFYGLVGAYAQFLEMSEEKRKLIRERYLNQGFDNINIGNQQYSGNYAMAFNRYNRPYLEYLKRSDFDDALLIDLKGDVVYSARRGDAFTERLLDPKWQEKPVGKAFAELQKKTKLWLEEKNSQRARVKNASINDQKPIIFTDFSQDEQGNRTAWFATSITQNDYLHSYIMFRLPDTAMANMLSRDQAQGFVKTLLVGQDHILRNPSETLKVTELQSQAIDEAIDGQTGVGSFENFDGKRVLSAYAPVSILGHQWGLVLELPEEEAFARISQLEKIFVVVMVSAIILVVLASHLLSNSITSPLLRLTWAAEQVSAGDMDQEIAYTDRRDEIGRLATSFARMQRSISDKLALIKEQNTKLEENIALIQTKNSELKQADKMKDDFLATTSHELRTPLHGMVGMAESMLAGIEGNVPDQQKSQLQMMISSGQRLSSLVDDLLDYHKMRYGELDMHLEAVDTSSAVRLVIELSSHLIGNKPVRIINQMPIDLPLVKADEQRLEQVLYNLVGNAIKYTDEGKVIIKADAVNDSVQIQVMDTGQGIPSEEIDYIFEPLTQARQTASNYRQGAGLGLSISRKLIEIMDGQLYVSSQPMIGTTFSFTLPLASKGEIDQRQQSDKRHHFSVPAPQETFHSEDKEEENSEAPLILVVDDEPVNLQILKNFLKLEGYRVITAENGRQAIEMVTLRKPQMLLLDVMMPELSGYDVCQHLREHHTKTELPIIMLSALTQMQDRIKGFDVGANDYLAKPFNKNEISARIRAYIDAHLTDREREQNQALQHEIHLREQAEAGLIETQNRLLNLLDTVPESIICVHDNGRIKYANDASGRLFSLKPEQIERHVLEDFLITPLPDASNSKGHYSGNLNFRVRGITTAIQTDVFVLPESSGIHTVLLLNTDDDIPTHRLQTLENAIQVLADFAYDGNQSNLDVLRGLGGEFSNMADKLDRDKPDKTDTLRETLVSVMVSALEYWQEETGKNKFALAEESGLWRVYLDRSTLQTRTLDKYLQVETLPKSPRWRTVLKTIDFVLDKTQPGTESFTELKVQRDRLQTLITR